MTKKELKVYTASEIDSLGLAVYRPQYDMEKLGYVKVGIGDVNLVRKGYVLGVYRHKESGELVAQIRHCIPF